MDNPFGKIWYSTVGKPTPSSKGSTSTTRVVCDALCRAEYRSSCRQMTSRTRSCVAGCGSMGEWDSTSPWFYH
jgi:hypothetical protein